MATIMVFTLRQLAENTLKKSSCMFPKGLQ